MHIKMKNMKGIDLSCASPSSTAICSSMDQRSMIKNSTKSFHRLNSYIGDHYKSITNNTNNPYYPSRAPCISELPFTPRPSSFSTYREKTRKLTSSEVKHSDVVTRRRSSADVTDLKRYDNHSSRSLLGNESTRSYCSTKNYDTSTPVFGSSEGRRSTSRVQTRRFGSMLEAENDMIRKHFSLIDVSDDQRKVNLGVRHRNNAGETCYDGHTSMAMGNDSLVKKTSPRSHDQVVVLRVSLHCRGCENKLRKHLSKMEGVTSYNIDMETKKVTIIGNVTPIEVLTNISKVKNAQFWPSQASSSSSSISSSSTSSSSTMELN